MLFIVNNEKIHYREKQLVHTVYLNVLCSQLLKIITILTDTSEIVHKNIIDFLILLFELRRPHSRLNFLFSQKLFSRYSKASTCGKFPNCNASDLDIIVMKLRSHTRIILWIHCGDSFYCQNPDYPEYDCQKADFLIHKIMRRDYANHTSSIHLFLIMLFRRYGG